MVKKLGIYNFIAVLVMIIGVLLFVLTPVFMKIDWDTDIIGLMVFVVGIAMLVVGIIIRSLTRKKA